MDKNSSYSTPLMYKKKIKSRNTLLPGTIYYSIDYWWPGALVTLTLLFSYWQTAVVCLPGGLHELLHETRNTKWLSSISQSLRYSQTFWRDQWLTYYLNYKKIIKFNSLCFYNLNKFNFLFSHCCILVVILDLFC